jgi:hypothetical protein
MKDITEKNLNHTTATGVMNQMFKGISFKNIEKLDFISL